MTGAAPDRGRPSTCDDEGATGHAWPPPPPVASVPSASALWCPHPGRLTRSLATSFHRFLTRFSGRRRTKQNHRIYPPPWSFLVVVLVSSLVSIVDACSSRSIPRPRPPPHSSHSTPRPDVKLPEYECREPYSSAYCLNGGICFMIMVGPSVMYNCRCAEGYLGERCEFKDLDGSYIHSQGRYILETASIAGGATIAVFLVVSLCVATYLKWRKRKKLHITQDINQNGEGAGLASSSEKVRAIKEEDTDASDSNSQTVRTVCEGGDQIARLGPQRTSEVSGHDPILLDRGDQGEKQGALVRTV